MSKFNTSNTNSMKVLNKCGHVAYKMENKLKLTTMVLTSMFGEAKFYGDNTNELVKLAEETDMKFVSNLAIYTRKEIHLRSVSHALTAIVARHGSEYTKQTVLGVVERADDMTEILACYLSMYGKPIPNALKKGLALAMNKFNEYQFAKYNGGNKSVKFSDILKLTHPKGNTELFGKIIKDELQTPYTWEVELSTRGNTKEVWEELINSGKVGYMALLRNFRNIIKADPSNLYKVLMKLSDKEEVLKSKQLPFRYLAAYVAIKNEGLATSKIYNTLEIAIKHSVENLEKIKGKTLIAIDVSGSMGSRISSKSEILCSDIAALMASMANYLCEDCKILSFDTMLREVTVPSINGIIQNAISMQANGGGTNLTLPFQWLIANGCKFDRVLMFSDNEINYRYERTCQSFVDIYKEKINPNLWIHAVDLQGYGTQQFIGKNTNIIAGWSERVLEFINLAESGIDNIVTKIEKYI